MSTLSDISGFSGNKLTNSSEKPTFSQTCNLLSQYFKDNKGSFEGLNLQKPCTPKTNVSPDSSCHSVITMDLFPTNVTPRNLTTMDFFTKGINHPHMVKESKTAQFTMFYDGQVFVLDDFPAEKFEVMKSIAAAHETDPKLIDMPIARKASLLRFMEKRKDRVTANAPYARMNPDSAPEKPSESIPWLELCAKST